MQPANRAPPAINQIKHFDNHITQTGNNQNQPGPQQQKNPTTNYITNKHQIPTFLNISIQNFPYPYPIIQSYDHDQPMNDNQQPNQESDQPDNQPNDDNQQRT